MKIIKYFSGLLVLLSLAWGCTKETYDDISFINSANSPSALSALFDITQDNTGLVTILPMGEASSYFDIYFGDNTATPVRVLAGKSAQHNYNEGQYNVKVVGYNSSGQTTESTVPLTVSFRAPEDLKVTTAIDANNNLTLHVSATALYETVFKVYFGEDVNEVPVSFLEGETVSHKYATTGTYSIKVVAYGGAATTEYTKDIQIVDPLLLPLDFESPTLVYAFSNFDGGNSTVISNPHSTGINTSSKVGQMVKNAGQTWGGSVISLSSPIDFSTKKMFKMKVYSPRVGAKVLLKVENLTDGGINYEKEVLTKTANAWEELSFDYSGISTSNSYQKIVLIFDNGTMGDGSSNYTFLFDDIMQTTAPGNITLFDFEGGPYSFTNFNGGAVTVISNPHSVSINTSAHVAQMVKNADQTWGGSWIDFGSPIDFSSKKYMKMKVYSPRVGAKVLLKVENASDGGINYEKEVSTTVANAWEELTFDYTGINTANSYQKIVLIFDNGTMGDGSANFTFLFDDIMQSSSPGALTLFNFETGSYTFTDFDGGAASVISNPQATGINTSTKVGQMIKNSGQTWGGSWIDYGSNIDFSTKKTFTMKVYSPRVGAKVLLKVENASTSSQSYEKEVLTTVANTWEELTFDYSAINTANTYQHLVLIFDNGTAGDGSANYTFLFDDITLK
jgi:hypothetical protein